MSLAALLEAIARPIARPQSPALTVERPLPLVALGHWTSVASVLEALLGWQADRAPEGLGWWLERWLLLSQSGAAVSPGLCHGHALKMCTWGASRKFTSQSSIIAVFSYFGSML